MATDQVAMGSDLGGAGWGQVMGSLDGAGFDSHQPASRSPAAD